MDSKRIKLEQSEPADAADVGVGVDESTPDRVPRNLETGQVTSDPVNCYCQHVFAASMEALCPEEMEQTILDLEVGEVWFSRQLNGMEDILPEEILHHIFRYLDDFYHLRKCRMVCKSWKSAIDNCPALIKKFVFNASHIEDFCQSSVGSKIRAIVVDSILPGGKTKLKKLFTVIGKNIESVKLDADTDVFKNSQDETRFRMIFETLLTSCPKLERVSISTANLIIAGGSPELKGDVLACKNKFHSVKKLKIFEYWQTAAYEIEDVERVLGMFPSVESLRLRNGGYEEEEYTFETYGTNKILAGLVAHMKKGPTALKLIDIRGYLDGEDETCHDLFLTVVQLSLRVKLILGHPICEHYTMQHFVENGMTLTPENSWFITSGSLRFYDEEIMPEFLAKFGECFHLEELTFEFHRRVTSEELSFLSKLTKLRKVNIEEFNECHRNFDTMPLCPTVEVLNISSEGCSYRDFYAPFSLSAIHKCFPNLQEIEICSLRISEDFFGSLAQFERLIAITISDCALPDHVLAKQLYYPSQLDKLRNREDPIAILKNLVKLEIRKCSMLTEYGLNAIMKTGRYKMEHYENEDLFRFDAIVR